MSPTLSYDREANAVYIRLRDVPYAFGEDLDRERHIDYGADKRPIGIELLCIRGGVVLDDLPERETVTHLLQQYQIPIASPAPRES